MRHYKSSLRGLSGLLMLFAGIACQPGTPASTTPGSGGFVPPDAGATLSLHQAIVNDGIVTVDLLYARAADQPAPRVAEIRVEYAAAALSWEGFDALDAAGAADKQVVVQDKKGSLRVLLFATDNTAALDSGGLARLHFKRLSHAPTSLSFMDHQPTFAPPEANAGLVLGPPLVIEGG
jgi:hypothetical protein